MLSLEPEGSCSRTNTEEVLNIGCLYSEIEVEDCLENWGTVEKENSNSLNTTCLATKITPFENRMKEKNDNFVLGFGLDYNSWFIDLLVLENQKNF